ncbi:tRNA (guanosine(46)-N7)-methyltransferase TrmB [Chengkuizengella axinellae]|uniref:tRNA (guanine-N(7)-)-methyltransferase n=1 Tax=Chengkuizengella axinellae TaxID=3064388 RepID=A0ABT9J5L0_9BACL|nr:tRNA (guanosine(46)-N7)-methyltransferase TrmB [Chengkuizengella sp. 2205SS18-9]MDP5276239.1 tRNA (guanosine(46)-N7)-methyltransferase TrmB [Chengkuizengella sp. 2205SS18-9]
MGRLRRRSDTLEFLANAKDVVVLEPQIHKGKWRKVFGNDNPIHVELGMGKGKFISEMSLKYPEINFIGIDLYDELVRKASEKSYALREEHGVSDIDNLRLLLMNIEKIEEVFDENEIDQIYLNFSDPWPKKRHASRRLTHSNFLKKYRQVLKVEGEIHLKTDSVSLFEFSLNSFADMDLKMKNISLDLHREETPENHVFTEYEEKFVEQGVRIHRCEVIL